MAKKNNFLDGYQTYDTNSGYGNAESWKGAFKQRMSKEDAALHFTANAQTPHEVLGLQKGASKSDIKKAFRTLIRQWHPDVNQHRLAEAEAMSKKIIAAYTLLS
ncbi:DnaJ domain-containing protein [Chitinophaga jiangningensis]|uniref:DnaJ domain-containing protein n=1 Tax=Chitinophaga jiangningensis TaxID=1419482 RepID=A0A1M6XZA2_9BACT|nr:J domain-containing protein [Chitinophaga jiangningensis]SHL11330.1 DnaJ domain-containing protein [Chitinophaga jiangningensis]